MNLYHLAFIHFQNLWILHSFKIHFRFLHQTPSYTLYSLSYSTKNLQSKGYLTLTKFTLKYDGWEETVKLLLCGSIQHVQHTD